MTSPHEDASERLPDYFELRDIDAGTYESAELGRWLEDELLNLPKSSSILDFGCGFGQNLRGIKAMGFGDIVGADINPPALRACRTGGLTVFDVSNGIHVLAASHDPFDCIITTHVLEHIPKKEVVSVVSGLRALLKPGGILIVAVPNAQSYTGAYWAYEDFTHETLYTYGSLRYVLKASGFSNVNLIDRDATAGQSIATKLLRRLFFRLHGMRYSFWKRALASPTHITGTDVFTYEIKMLARAPSAHGLR